MSDEMKAAAAKWQAEGKDPSIFMAKVLADAGAKQAGPVGAFFGFASTLLGAVVGA